MEQNTHPRIDPKLVGVASTIDDGRAVCTLEATSAMAADHRDLVHGGFTFGLADFAAMCAVNDPNVVLGGASCRFLAPVVVGQTMIARAEVTESKGKKRVVSVTVEVDDKKVLDGELTCFVLPHHVLDGNG